MKTTTTAGLLLAALIAVDAYALALLATFAAVPAVSQSKSVAARTFESF